MSRIVGSEAIAEAAACLRAGGVVAFPTETVYGLGADALNVEAVRRVFAIKGRPADHPLIVHLASAESLPDWSPMCLPRPGILHARSGPVRSRSSCRASPTYQTP